jgi:hypothetical protein
MEAMPPASFPSQSILMIIGKVTELFTTASSSYFENRIYQISQGVPGALPDNAYLFRLSASGLPLYPLQPEGLQSFHPVVHQKPICSFQVGGPFILPCMIA